MKGYQQMNYKQGARLPARNRNPRNRPEPEPLEPAGTGTPGTGRNPRTGPDRPGRTGRVSGRPGIKICIFCSKSDEHMSKFEEIQ